MRTLHALSVNVLNDRVIGLGLWVILLVPPMSFSPPALLHLKKRCGRFFTPSVDSQAKMEAGRRQVVPFPFDDFVVTCVKGLGGQGAVLKRTKARGASSSGPASEQG